MSLISKITIIYLFLYAGVAGALESDSEQPVYIESDKAVYDEKKDISTYTGNVHATQGSINIDGDQLVVYMKNGTIEHLVSTGVWRT